jgi:hypothetical protein
MARQTKPKIGRPKLPKGEAKGRIVPIRFNTNDLRVITKQSKSTQQSISEWIRDQVAIGAYPILERAILCTIESGASMPVPLTGIRHQVTTLGGPLYGRPDQEEQIGEAISRLEREGRIKQEESPGGTAPFYVLSRQN